MVASGELKAPIVIGRDHLDCGSVASPYRETEAMLDGSDAIADWALLNALVNTASGASWVSIHHGGGVGMGRSIHAGQVCVADGTALAAREDRARADQRPGHGRDPARRRGLRGGGGGRERARRADSHGRLTGMTKEPARSRVTLPGISSRAWEHPADRGALVALRKLKGFDAVLKAMSGLFNERAVRLAFLGSAIRVDERQFSRLHALLADVSRILDAPEMPELFVSANPVPNALTVGMNKPFIVVSSGLVDLLDDEEMRFVLAHEVGHAMSGHAVYQTLLQRLIQLSGVLNTIPMGGLGVRAIMAALMEWSRKAELSADRAGLLATQDPPTAFRVHMQLASGATSRTSTRRRSSRRARSTTTPATCATRCSSCCWSRPGRTRSPWSAPPSCGAGSTRGSTPAASRASTRGATPTPRPGVSEAAKAAARSYSETFRQSQDAVGKLVHDAAGFLGSAKLWLDDVLRRGEDWVTSASEDRNRPRNATTPGLGPGVVTLSEELVEPSTGATDRNKVQNQTHDDENDADRRENRDVRHETDDEQNQTKNNHVTLPSIGCCLFRCTTVTCGQTSPRMFLELV